MRKIWALIALATTLGLGFEITPARAVECKPDEECKVCKLKKVGPWDGTVSAGFNFAQGNTDTYLLNAGGRATYEKDEDILKLGIDFRHGETDDERNVDDGSTFINYNYVLPSNLYFVLGTDGFRDEIAGVKYRVAAYPGLGYYFIKSDTMKLNLDIGPSYTFEKQGSEENDYLAARGNQAFEWKMTETAKITEGVVVTMPVDDTEDVLVVSKVGLEVAINSSFSLAQIIEDRFDARPAPGRLKNDVLILAALIYNF